MISVEEKIQSALHNWFCLAYPKYAHLFYHAPNGGKRHPTVAKKLKAAGTKKGFPDICIFLPTADFCFYAMELKTLGTETKAARKGKPTKEQLAWLNDLAVCGASVEMCWGFEAARESIKYYMRDAVKFNWKGDE